MRTNWNGSISFGLVNIPIGLVLATEAQASASDVAFKTLHRECGTPIRMKRWCPTHDREVAADELVKGWEVSKGRFVPIEDADLEAIQLESSQAIEIERFVRLEDVDPAEEPTEATVLFFRLETAQTTVRFIDHMLDSAKIARRRAARKKR